MYVDYGTTAAEAAAAHAGMGIKAMKPFGRPRGSILGARLFLFLSHDARDRYITDFLIIFTHLYLYSIGIILI